MKHLSPQEYFMDNAEQWIFDGYNSCSYNYPTPAHRLRIISNILDNITNIHSAVDIGCGGGHISIELARRGINVLGIDESLAMIKSALKNIHKEKKHVQDKIKIKKINLYDLPADSYDLLIAMGLIGYLPNDDILFSLAAQRVLPGGYIIISFRNRLFNLFSPTWRTVYESDSNNLKNLIAEYNSLKKEISINETITWLDCLLNSIKRALDTCRSNKFEEYPNEVQRYTGKIEARQSTPEEVKKCAKRYGFTVCELIGVHPHFSIPSLNTCLPAGIYNELSNAFIPLEKHPLSLLWSSVFICLAQKNSN